MEMQMNELGHGLQSSITNLQPAGN
jgi:hypothetical protein